MRCVGPGTIAAFLCDGDPVRVRAGLHVWGVSHETLDGAAPLGGEDYASRDHADLARSAPQNTRAPRTWNDTGNAGGMRCFARPIGEKRLRALTGP